MAELDFEPFDCEAFPGLEFFLSGDRDMLTLNAFESANERRLPLLSLERRGYVVRHTVPSDFAPIPPADAGRLPLEGQAHQVPRPPRREEGRVDRARFPMPAARAEPPRTPDLPFANTHLRLRQHDGPFGGPSVYLEARVHGDWSVIGRFDQDNGRFTRMYHDAWAIPALRQAGFCISRDGALAVANPTPRQRAHPLPEPPPQEPEPRPPIADLPFADQVLAFQERIEDLGRFLRDNRPLHEKIRKHFQRAQLPNGFAGPDNWTGFFERTSREHDALRGYLANAPGQPERAWIKLHYRWRERPQFWELRGAHPDFAGEDIPRGMRPNERTLPNPLQNMIDGDDTRRDRYPEGWNRYVWVNTETCEIYPNAGQPPNLAIAAAREPAPGPNAEQGGGEGDLENAEGDIAAPPAGAFRWDRAEEERALAAAEGVGIEELDAMLEDDPEPIEDDPEDPDNEF